MLTKAEITECLRCFLENESDRLFFLVVDDSDSCFEWYKRPDGGWDSADPAERRFRRLENEEPEEGEEGEEEVEVDQFVVATVYAPRRVATLPDVQKIPSLLTGFICLHAHGTGRRKTVLVMCSSKMVLTPNTGWKIIHRPRPVLGGEMQAVASFFALGLEGEGDVPRDTILEEHFVQILAALEMLRVSGSVTACLDVQNRWRQLLVARRNEEDELDEAKVSMKRDLQAVNQNVFEVQQKVGAFVECTVPGGQCQTVPQPQAHQLLAELQLFSRFLGLGSPDVPSFALTLFQQIFSNHVQRQSSHAANASGVIDVFVGNRDDDVLVLAFTNPTSMALVHTTKCEDITLRARQAGGVRSCSWPHALSRCTQVFNYDHTQPQPNTITTTIITASQTTTAHTTTQSHNHNHTQIRTLAVAFMLALQGTGVNTSPPPPP